MQDSGLACVAKERGIKKVELVLAVMDATERGDGIDDDSCRNKFKVRDRAKDWLG